jgi:hypothetical protein
MRNIPTIELVMSHDNRDAIQTIKYDQWKQFWLQTLRYKSVGRSSIPDEVNGFFDWPNPSSRTMTLGSTQPLTEMSTRNLPGDKGRSARKTNLTAIREPIV